MKDEYRITDPWERILDCFGISYTKRSSGVLVFTCVFHAELHPSAHAWPKSGRFRCHGCDAGGSKLEFVIACTMGELSGRKEYSDSDLRKLRMFLENPNHFNVVAQREMDFRPYLTGLYHEYDRFFPFWFDLNKESR